MSIDPICILSTPVFEYSHEEWTKLLSSDSIYLLNQDRLNLSMKLGIPDNLRKEIWLFLSRARLSVSPSTYSRLLVSPEPHIVNLIERDIHRTFPESLGLSTASLLNILIAYSQFDFEVGYCQGMTFVVSVLLLIINDEELTFWAFVYIMFDKNWRAVYLKDTPKLNQLMDILEQNIKEKLPKVYKHLSNNGVQMVMMSQHFITILAYKVKTRFAVRLMDVFLCVGEGILVKVVYNMIKLKKDKILSMNQEFLFRFMIESLVNECYDEFHITTLFAD